MREIFSQKLQGLLEPYMIHVTLWQWKVHSNRTLISLSFSHFLKKTQNNNRSSFVLFWVLISNQLEQWSMKKKMKYRSQYTTSLAVSGHQRTQTLGLISHPIPDFTLVINLMFLLLFSPSALFQHLFSYITWFLFIYFFFVFADSWWWGLNNGRLFQVQKGTLSWWVTAFCCKIVARRALDCLKAMNNNEGPHEAI